jgi:carbon-monoxide dehydrogenase medium subunit
MIPNAFDYRRASSIDDALGAIGTPGTKVIAGGMSLLPLMKLRLANPDRLVDIGRLAELRGVRQLPDGRLAIGALTTYSELMDSPARHYGLLRDALPDIGDVQVRNRGTVGGAVAHCDPTSRPCSWPSTPRSSRAPPGASTSTARTASSPARSRRRWPTTS